MVEYTVQRRSLQGVTQIPSSKSHTLRAILFASLADGVSIIEDPLMSPDTEAMIHACSSLGATIQRNLNQLVIQGIKKVGALKEHVIDAMNSGQVLRFYAAVAALSSDWTVITGDDSIKKLRPVDALLSGLRQMGAFAESCSNDGRAPIIVRGPLKSDMEITIDGKDSQPVSALLIAASLIEGITKIHVKNPGEKPWLLLTCDWLKRMGVHFEYSADLTFFTVQGKTHFSPFTYRVPGDLSSLAFPLVAALVTEADITIENVDLDDIQGDKVLIDILHSMGAHFTIDKKAKTIRVKGPQNLQGISIDINQCIDALPILSVIGCFARGKTHLYNAEIARYKECDRIQAMASELQKMGATVQEIKDGLVITESNLFGVNVNTYNDHRIALSLVIAGLMAEGATKISAIECTQKTYPQFVSEIERLSVKEKLS